MPRSNLIIDLVEAQRRGDARRFQSLVEAIIAEERDKQHHLVADRLAELITSTGVGGTGAVATPGRGIHDSAAAAVADLVHDVVPRRLLSSLVLPDVAATAAGELIEEHQRAELLRTHGIEPRSRVLLEGPPGNGKTSLAEAVAAELMVPLYVIRYEGLISSFLGETTARLDRVFEFVRSRRCVIFFDEFDSIAKERGDAHETGEIKRVVSTLLLQIDRLPAHVVAIAATNHGELLDRAAWRRFQLRLTLPNPTRTQAAAFLAARAQQLGGDLGLAPRTLADKLGGASYAELEDIAQDIRRRWILALPHGDLRAIARHQIDQWRHQSRASLDNDD